MLLVYDARRGWEGFEDLSGGLGHGVTGVAPLSFILPRSTVLLSGAGPSLRVPYSSTPSRRRASPRPTRPNDVSAPERPTGGTARLSTARHPRRPHGCRRPPAARPRAPGPGPGPAPFSAAAEGPRQAPAPPLAPYRPGGRTAGSGGGRTRPGGDMALYSAAAAVLEGLERGDGGIKTLVYNSRFPVRGGGRPGGRLGPRRGGLVRVSPGRGGLGPRWGGGEARGGGGERRRRARAPSPGSL